LNYFEDFVFEDLANMVWRWDAQMGKLFRPSP